MTADRVACRYPASAFPEIEGIRLTPAGIAATLVNMSATGILVQCASSALPGAALTVHFKGTFDPASIKSRVVRCEVAGIAADGSLRYHLGLVFATRLALPNEAGGDVDVREAALSAPLLAAAATEAVAAPVLRNRW
jgi:hypothetical protein